MKTINTAGAQELSSLFIADYKVSVLHEDNYIYTLKDMYNVSTKIPKYVLAANGISPEKGQLVLTGSLHGHYFGAIHREREEKAIESLKKSFVDIFRNKEQILRNPAFFHIRAFLSGSNMSGGSSYCIGSLFESWENSDALVIKEPTNNTEIFLVSITGSNLTGRNAWTGWNNETKQFVHGSLEENEWRGRLNEFILLGKRYPDKLFAQFVQIDQLLKEMKV